MRDKRTRLTLVGVLALALVVMLGLSAGAVDAKKKKKKRSPGNVDITQVANSPIIDRPTTGPRTVTNFRITVPSNFSGVRVRDVNLTMQVVGTGTDSVNDLGGRLTSPDGNNVWLFGAFGLDGNLLGPITFDDESTVTEMSAGTPDDPTTLFAPYQGSVQPQGPFLGNGIGSSAFPMNVFDNGPVAGVWTLAIIDYFNGNTNNLVSWRLNVLTGRPFKTK